MLYLETRNLDPNTSNFRSMYPYSRLASLGKSLTRCNLVSILENRSDYNDSECVIKGY